MVSSTRQTERRRSINTRKLGRAKKKARSRSSTPAFPVHRPDYDQNAPDAKKSGS
jgi:hypothetical protein